MASVILFINLLMMQSCLYKLARSPIDVHYVKL